MMLRCLACLLMIGLVAGCAKPGGTVFNSPSGSGALAAASGSKTTSGRSAKAVRSRLLRGMMLRAGVLAVCGQTRYARRAIWNAMITNRLPPAIGQWSLPQLRLALKRSIQVSVALRNRGRLQCRSRTVLRVARNTNAIYALLRRKYPKIPSAEAIASRRGTARGRQNTRRRRISDLFDAPSRGIRGF